MLCVNNYNLYDPDEWPDSVSFGVVKVAESKHILTLAVVTSHLFNLVTHILM